MYSICVFIPITLNMLGKNDNEENLVYCLYICLVLRK